MCAEHDTLPPPPESTPVEPPPFPKTCSCGRTYDKDAWQTLPFVGVQAYVGFANDPVERLDFRNCECRNTCAISLPEGVSVCVRCHKWIEDAPRIVTSTGVFCSKCGPEAVAACR